MVGRVDFLLLRKVTLFLLVQVGGGGLKVLSCFLTGKSKSNYFGKHLGLLSQYEFQCLLQRHYNLFGKICFQRNSCLCRIHTICTNFHITLSTDILKAFLGKCMCSYTSRVDSFILSFQCYVCR